MSDPLAASLDSIVNVAYTATDGAGIAALRQSAALESIGIRSRFVTAAPAPTGNRERFSTISEDPPSLYARLARRFGFADDALERTRRAVQEILATSPDCPPIELFSPPVSRYSPEKHPWVERAGVVHLHWVAGLLDWHRFFSSITQPVIWTLHDQHPYLGGFHYLRDYEIAPPRLRTLDERFRREKQAAIARLRGPLTVIGNSRWNTENAQRSGVFPTKTQFATIYYPLDCDVYRPRDKNAAKAALGLPSDTFTIGFACTSVDNPRKGLGTLLNAIGELQVRRPNGFNLLSFGRDPDAQTRAEIRSQWSHLGFLQADAAKVAAYSAMDVFVIPSLAEAFGQTSIEALACGTPVIGANVGGIPETMLATAHEWLFPAGNAVELLRRLDAMIALPDRAQLAQEGRAHVLAQHSPRATAEAYAQSYRDLLGRR